MARVLAEDDVGRAQLVEQPQGHVVEVPDRRRADGERHLAQGVERDEARADQAGGGPQLGAHDPYAVARARQALTGDDLARGIEDEVARRGEAAADHHELRVEDVDEAADPGAKPSPDAVQDVDRPRLAFRRQPDEAVRVDGRAEHLLRELRGREAGHVRLEVAAARARALAGQTVVLDHDMAELGPTAVQPSVEDRAPAAPGAERQHHHRVGLPRRAEVELRVGRRVRVVLEPDRKTEALGHARAEVDRRVEWDVHCLPGPSRLLIDRRGDAEADRRDGVVQELLDRAVEARQQVVLRRDRRRVLAPALHVPVPVDDPREDLRSAEVDADDALSVQTARLPYWLDGDGREALSRLPRGAREGSRSARAAAEPARAERSNAARTARAADTAAAATLELAAPDRPDAARARRPARRLGDRGLPLVPRRSREGERPAAEDITR